MTRTLLTAVMLAALTASLDAAEKPKSPAQLELDAITVKVKSTLDGTDQPVVFYVPPDAPKGMKLPLLVALHSWSGGNEQASGYLPSVKERGWVMVAPNFRGPNNKPEACASDLAVQDVLDAVEYARAHADIDADRIYMMGGSGGGHMSLVMLSRAPRVWAGVSAWVPITDLVKWHEQATAKKLKYARDIEKVCGGPPGSPATDEQYRQRSSIFRLPAAKGVPVDINAGIHDGHSGSVPISQSLEAFNVLAEANGMADRMLTTDQIAQMTATQKVPGSLAFKPVDDPERRKRVLFRREAGPARVTIFDGGHEFELSAGLDWLARQRKGQPATHYPTGPVTLPGAGATEVSK